MIPIAMKGKKGIVNTNEKNNIKKNPPLNLSLN